MALIKREPFAHLHARMLPDIKRLSRSQRVIGMTAAEVEAELTEALWKAHRTYRKKMNLTIEQYWWAIWTNRKADLLAYAYAQKRAINLELLVDGTTFWQDEQFQPAKNDVSVPPAPAGVDELAERVWRLIGAGCTRSDILVICEISRRRFYQIIEQLRIQAMKENP